ncbi:MAG: hypothetical protein ACREH8_03190, partial [Opitutaceae bacterium]
MVVWEKKSVRQRVEGLGLREHPGLVGLDLQEVFAAFFDDFARVGFLAVQGVGRDELVVEGGDFFEQCGGGGLLAALGAFLLVVNGHRLQIGEPASVSRIRKLCGMRMASVCESLAQLVQQGIVAQDIRGY